MTAKTTLYLLDYQGTLDRLADPVAYVKALRLKGGYACLHSGTMHSAVRSKFPCLLECFDLILSKGPTIRELVEEIKESYSDVEQVTIVDDDSFYAEYEEHWNKQCLRDFKIGVKVVHAKDMESLIR